MITVAIDTYCTVEFADTYHISRGQLGWPVTPPILPPIGGSNHPDSRSRDLVIAKKEAALRSGTSWIDALCKGKWKGEKVALDQPLAWYRKGVIDEEGFEIPEDMIPVDLGYATAEAALRVYNGVPLAPDMKRGGKVLEQSVGNGAVRIKYMADAPSGTTYTIIGMYLMGLVTVDDLFSSGSSVTYNQGSIRMVF